MKRAYVLGSGFSRAISDEMPTLADLSSAVRQQLAAAGKPDLPGAGTPVANNFEQWLSYLVESPPWLSEGERHRNLAAFFDVSQAVYDVLDVKQIRAVQSPCPKWLQELVRYWHVTEATVVTLNYDVLVELAWLVSAASHSNWNALYPIPITSIMARSGRIPADDSFGGHFNLLKLHGSLTWRYSGPDSPPGDTIYDLGIKQSSWDAEGLGWCDRVWPTQTGPRSIGPKPLPPQRLAEDREPMIVPPAAVKSPYYANRTLQAIWKSAATAISEAEELVLMGFSLPQSDLLMSSMLTTNLPDDSIITPVDYSPTILKRVREVFALSKDDSRLIEVHAGRGDADLAEWVKKFASNVEDPNLPTLPDLD